MDEILRSIYEELKLMNDIKLEENEWERKDFE